MQRIYILFIAVISLSPVQLRAEEVPIIKASFYENATFRGHWEISIYEEGKVVAESNVNMLDFKNKAKKYSGVIDGNDLTNLCAFIENESFFEIEKHYATSGVMVDGPAAFMGVNCNGLANNIIYYPNSGDSSDNTSGQIAAIWQKLWSYSQIQAPSLTKYM